jgi:major membrane immunogen (membrane-anchored lipoprotein)
MMAWVPDDIKVGATLSSDGFKEDAQALIDAAGMTV